MYIEVISGTYTFTSVYVKFRLDTVTRTLLYMVVTAGTYIFTLVCIKVIVSTYILTSVYIMFMPSY